MSYRSDLSKQQYRRGDLSPRFVASCVSALRVRVSNGLWEHLRVFASMRAMRALKHARAVIKYLASSEDLLQKRIRADGEQRALFLCY